jgi:hypothetical protein
VIDRIAALVLAGCGRDGFRGRYADRAAARPHADPISVIGDEAVAGEINTVSRAPDAQLGRFWQHRREMSLFARGSC